MKILFIIPSLRSGGKERRFIELLKNLHKDDRLNLIVILLSDEIAYPVFKELDINYVIVKRKYKKDLSFLFKYINLIRNYKPDIIHSWSSMTSFYSILPSILLRIPLITNEISTSFVSNKKDKLLRLLEIINFRFADLIISNSDIGLQNSKAPKHKSITIYNGVHLKRFDQENKLESKVSSQFIDVVMVASFRENKRYDMLLDIADNYIEKNSKVRFIAVGNGKTFDGINKEAEKRNLHNIIFLGLVENVEEILINADIGLLLTEGEGLSNAVIEYMASKLPVVVTDTDGGTPELFRDGTAGFITKLSISTVIEKLNILIDSYQIRKQMGDLGREIIEKQFNSTKMHESFVRSYQNLLSKKS